MPDSGQPPGTLVSLAVRSGKGYEQHQRPIEDVRAGDRTVSWRSVRMGRLYRSGRPVISAAASRYTGELVEVMLPGGTVSRHTPSHACIAVIGGGLDGKVIVYLMRRGGDHRIGRTPWRYGSQNNTLGIVSRARVQGADAVWVLSVHDTDRDAALAEALAQHVYGIPGWQFRSLNEFMPLDEFWAKAGSNGDRAQRCLTEHGRDMRYPLWRPGQNRIWGKTPIRIRACNLMTGMRLCEISHIGPRDGYYAGRWTDAWQPAAIRRESYDGQVCALEVAEDHTYIADGVATCDA